MSRIPNSTLDWIFSPITLSLSDLLVSNGATSISRSFFRGRPQRASGLTMSARSANSLGPKSGLLFLRLSNEPLLVFLSAFVIEVRRASEAEISLSSSVHTGTTLLSTVSLIRIVVPYLNKELIFSWRSDVNADSKMGRRTSA